MNNQNYVKPSFLKSWWKGSKIKLWYDPWNSGPGHLALTATAVGVFMILFSIIKVIYNLI